MKSGEISLLLNFQPKHLLSGCDMSVAWDIMVAVVQDIILSDNLGALSVHLFSY